MDMYEGDDRVAQLNWLYTLAQNIAENLGEGTPEELVEFALSPEGRESWQIKTPTWFNVYDRATLVSYVETASA